MEQKWERRQNSDLLVPVAPEWKVTDKLSLECWVLAARPTEKNTDLSSICGFGRSPQHYGKPNVGKLASAGLAFCNGEARPWFGVFISGNNDLTAVWSDEVLSCDKPHHLVGVYDGREIRLYIDGKVAGQKEVSGWLDCPLGTFIMERPDVLFVRFWEIPLPNDQIDQLFRDSIPKQSGIRLTSFLIGKRPEEPKDVIVSWANPVTVRPVLSTFKTAKRILHAARATPSDTSDQKNVCRLASVTIRELCDGIERILTNPDADENSLLSYFKNSPAAMFLLELDQVSIWREKHIQGYGIIDFVVKRSSGRYVAIELESHKAPIFTSSDEFTTIFHHGIDQISQWQLGVRKQQAIPRDLFNMSGIDVPDGTMVPDQRVIFENRKIVQ